MRMASLHLVVFALVASPASSPSPLRLKLFTADGSDHIIRELNGALVAARLNSAPLDSTWRDHQAAARAAGARGDWREERAQLQVLDSIFVGHPAVSIAIARADMRIGDTSAAILEVERVAQMGATVEMVADSTIRRVVELRSSLAARLKENAAPIGKTSVVAVLPQHDFVAEGVAYDPAHRRILTSSIRHSTIVQISAKGDVSDYVDLRRDGGWSGLGLAVDSARNRLWVSTMWYPHDPRSIPADSGRSGVHVYDLATGAFEQRFELPRGSHEPGDICLSRDGDLFVSDGRQGAIYVIRRGSDSLAMFVPPGQLVSPQGCAIDESRRVLYVADYALGIVKVELESASVSRLPRSRYVATNGIDGLILRDDRLIGVQNGVTPNRIVMLHLDRDHRTVSSVRVIAQDTALIRAPTHLTTIGSDIVFVANGGFDQYDANGNFRAGAREVATRIRRVGMHQLSDRRTVDTSATKASLLAADQALARRAGENFLTAAEPGAAVLIPGQPVRSAAAAAESFRARYGSQASYTWRPAHAVASADGNFGCTVGDSRFIASQDRGRAASEGAYVSCWRRVADDQWRLVVHARNDSPPRPPAGFDSGVLPLAPASAGFAFSGNAFAEALDTDESFARAAEAPAGPGPAFGSFAASDGLLINAAMSRGPADIARLFDGFPSTRVLEWDPIRVFGAGSGGLAVTVGHSVQRDRGDTPGETARVKYVTVWRQNSTGGWEYIFDLGSPWK